jgi:NAD(P)-dependent dehydrogenase (short-subunit alcohol dehydrogenase family)
MTSPQKVALITGAGSGIGRAVAVAMQGEGYDCVLAGRRKPELEKTAAMAKPEGGRMLAVAANVADPLAVNTLFARTRDAFGRLDVLFNNAGTFTPPVPIEDLTLEQWQNVVDVNLTGAFLCAQGAIRMMKAQSPKGGRIINNGSISAHTPRPNAAAYTATKHAITGLTKSIALDGRAHDIACSQIDIGNAETDLTLPMVTGAGSLQPNGARMVEPRFDVQHVAKAVLMMANLPLDANVQFMTLMATKMPYVGRG